MKTLANKNGPSTPLGTGGTVAVWGDEFYWQDDLPGGNNYIAVATGYTHSIALKSTGGIKAWGGFPNYGQSDEPGGTTTSPVVEKYSYDVFGKPTIKAPNGTTRTQSAVGNRFMFTGREYDSETGNYYYRARYYSPKLGRFLQTDPIYFTDSLNLYVYCNNNPIMS